MPGAMVSPAGSNLPTWAMRPSRLIPTALLLLAILDHTGAVAINRHPACKVEGSDDFDLSPLQRGEE